MKVIIVMIIIMENNIMQKPLSFHDLEFFHLKSKLQQTPPEVLFPLTGARP